MKNSRLYAYLLLLLTVIYACTPKDPEPDPSTVLVSATKVDAFTAQEFKNYVKANLGGIDFPIDLSLLVVSGIDRYKIVYKTKDTFGNDVTASGAFIVPTSVTTPMALGSVQHGTIFTETDAPSYFKSASEASIGSLLASNGMFIVMPDYLGYGSAVNQDHPYENYEGLSEPSIDLLRAVKEFMTDKQLNWNKKLLLAGYSEGGYATMAILKKLQDKYPSEFMVVATSCGAGAYNKTATVQAFANGPSAGDVSHNRSYVWFILTLNKLNGLNRPVSSYFKEPYASQIEANGINVNFTGNFADLLQDSFVAGIKNGTDTGFLNAVKANDIYDWKPTTTLRLYHGTADTYVPFLNSQTAYDAMTQRGAPNVSLNPIVDANHNSAIGSYLTGTFQLFTSNR